MHDIFAIVQTTHKNIQDCKSFNDGAHSDHANVSIKLAITYIKSKHNLVIKEGTDWTKISVDAGFAALYCETLKFLLDRSTFYDNFNSCILKVGEQTEKLSNKNLKGGFSLAVKK